MSEIMGKVQNWMNKNIGTKVGENFEKTIIIVLLGIFMLLVASPMNHLSSKKKTNTTQTMKTSSLVEKNNENDVYISSLENKLEQIIEGMEGAGKTKVMITLKNHGEKVVDKNQPYENENHKEVDDKKEIENTRVQSEQETVLIEQDGNTTPYVIMEYCPKIEGVVVVCDGGDNKQLSIRIKEVVQTLFNLDAHKVCVCKSNISKEVK